MKDSNEKELKKSLTFKTIIFRFFYFVNKYRSISRSLSIFMISVSFFQMFYILDFLIKYRNNNIGYEYMNKNFSIFDVIGILMRFSLLLPILEVDSSLLPIFLNIILVFTYFFIFNLIICIIYVFYCLYREKEVYFILTLSYISTFFQYFQYVLYLPSLYILLYSIIGFHHDSLSAIVKNNYINTFNITLSLLMIILNLIISLLNNDSINRYDNAFCRKDCDIEILIFYVKTILFFTFLLRDSISITVSNFLCLISSLIIIFLIYKQVVIKYYYDKYVSQYFAAFTLCYLEKAMDGLFNIFISSTSNDYNFTIIMCFFFNYKVFEYHYNSMDTVILKKNIGNLKDIDQMIFYMDNLEEETNKSSLGDENALSLIGGYLINHKAYCHHLGCPLNQKELFHPLTNRYVEVANTIYEISKNEVILAHLLKEIFINLGDKFSGNTMYHFAYSNFLIFRMGNPKLALIEIEKSLQYSTSLQQEYSLFLLKQIANDRLLNNPFYIAMYSNFNISIADIIDIIVFDILVKQFESGIEECTRLKINFWSVIKENQVLIEDLLIKGEYYLNKKRQITKLWNNISDISKNHKKVNDLYVLYKEYICDDFSSLINNDQKTKKIEIDLNDVVHKRFFDDTGFFIVNCNLGVNIGNISYHNKTINKLLRYDNDELIGKNINFIQPDRIARAHNYFISNYIQTGKNKIIGKNYPVFAKDKEKFLIPIFTLVLPLPNFSYKSELLGLVRERKTEGFNIIVNEYGIIDCFSREFMKYDSSLDPIKELNGVSLYIFYFFPELLYSNDQQISKAKRPIFLKEKKMLEITSINAYFDVEMIKFIQELESTSRSKNNEIKKDRLKNKDFEKSKLNKNKLKIYKDYKKTCAAIKEFIKRQQKIKISPNKANSIEKKNNLIKNDIESTNLQSFDCETSNYSGTFREKNFIDHYEYYFKYKKFMDSLVEECKGETKKRVYKKQFVVKIQPLRLSYKGNESKVYIFEFSIPPSDLESFKGEEEIDSKILEAEDLHSMNKNQYDDDLKRSMDDTGSVSTVRDNNNSILNVVQRLRDENKKNENFHKSSYMNYLLYMLVFLLLSFIIYYNLYLNYFTGQQYFVTQNIKSHYDMKKSLLYLRKYVYLKNLNMTLDSISNSKLINEFKGINSRIIQISNVLLDLNRNITSLSLNIDNKDFIEKIMRINYIYNGKNYIASDIIDYIILLSLYIAQPSLLNNSTTLIQNGNLQQIISKFKEISLNLDYAFYFIISNTNNVIQSILDKKISIMITLYHSFHDEVFNIIKVGYIVISSLCFFIFLFIFMILKERYNYNQTIFEFLKQISNTEIDEILNKLEQFLKMFKSSYYCVIETSEENNCYDTDITLIHKEERKKVIARDENIFFSFFFNIALIIFLIISYFLVNYFTTYFYINQFDLGENFSLTIWNSNFKNLQLITNYRDVYISNKTSYYDDNNLVINYLNSSFYDFKITSDKLFYDYSLLKYEFSSQTQSLFDSIFFSTLCSNQYVNISCSSNNKTNIFYKGFKFGLTNYANQIEKINFYYDSMINKDLLSIFINQNSLFYQPSNLEENEFNIIYNLILSELSSIIIEKSTSFCLVIIVISISCIFLILLSITLNWKKYANKIMLEEFMSNKIIAEIPMYIIMNNKIIREHLLDFSNKT